MLFIVISETLYSYSCNNRKPVGSMLSSAVFQKTSPRSLGWNTGRSGFSEPGCHRLGIRAGLDVGRPRPRERYKPVEIDIIEFGLMLAFGCCICLLHSMHIALVFVLTVYPVSVAGIGSDPLQLNLCISPVPFLSVFGVNSVPAE